MGCYRRLWRVVLTTSPFTSYVRHSPAFLSSMYSPSSSSAPLGGHLFQSRLSSSNEPVCINSPLLAIPFHSPSSAGRQRHVCSCPSSQKLRQPIWYRVHPHPSWAAYCIVERTGSGSTSRQKSMFPSPFSILDRSSWQLSLRFAYVLPPGRLISQRNECAQPVIAQEEPCPGQHGEDDRDDE